MTLADSNILKKNSRIYVAGHNGLVGSAIVHNLRARGYTNLLTVTHGELDLIDTKAVEDFFAREQPEFVFLAAAKVGGIMANNTYRAEFIYENLMVQNNVIHQSYKYGVKKLLFLGSSCIYPKNSPQPIQENNLLGGELEYTNEPYAIAKIAGIKMCESYNIQYGTNFIAVMPTNLYGPGDNFDLEKSHVLPALIRKIYLGACLERGDWEAIRHDLHKRPVVDIAATAAQDKIRAKLADFGVIYQPSRVEIWGSGKPLREFLWSEDMADACVFVMERVNFTDTYNHASGEIRNTHINIGSGTEINIKALAVLIKNLIGFKGELVFNATKPDGTMRKLTDISKLTSLGWQPHTSLEQGIKQLLAWYCK